MEIQLGLPYGRALAHLTGEVAHDGVGQEAGHYRIGYAFEDTEPSSRRPGRRRTFGRSESAPQRGT
jgi:hypothetical protein